MTSKVIAKKFEEAIKSDLKESIPSNMPRDDEKDTFDIKAFRNAAERAARVLEKEEEYVNTGNRAVYRAY